MFRWLKRQVRILRCRRHRWRPIRDQRSREFCDLCGARRSAPAAS